MKCYSIKNGFEGGKNNKASFCYQLNLGMQGMDNAVVYAFINAVYSEYSKILTQAVLNNWGQDRGEDNGKQH